MELRHLRYFVAVAEELNFRRAAARLHLAAPPLSRAIRDLERELGTQLLERSTRHVALTDDGRLLLARATAILDRADAVTNGVRVDAVGPLRVGMVADTNDTARTILRTLNGEHPALAVERTTLTSSVSRPALGDGTLDVTVSRARHERGLASELVRRERLAVLLRCDHALADREQVELAELGGQALYLPPEAEAPAWHRFVVEIFAQAGATPTVVEGRYGGGPAAFADVVERFGHAAVVVRSDAPGRPGVRRVAISDEHAVYPWSAVYLDRAPLPAPIAWFLAAARIAAARENWLGS